ncbi:hypothetical protein JOF56_004597 [Kibdelosporangium banguiense]|uniref:Peptidase inhibitor family I36 n=1 Tax=Kibdelosporangium banguiense TaxID=1365924 RepID=A0ABS4TIG3_9PSEU|nr:hypothetical protein [Kibdelosporangium banguiense]
MRLKSALLTACTLLTLTPTVAQAAPAQAAAELCQAGNICTYYYLFQEGKNFSRSNSSISGCVDIPESQSYHNAGVPSLKLWKYSNCTGDWVWATAGTVGGASFFSFDAVSR